MMAVAAMVVARAKGQESFLEALGNPPLPKRLRVEVLQNHRTNLTLQVPTI